MATITPGPTVDKIAGALGNKVYSSWKGREYIRAKSSNRSNPSSPRQAEARAGTTALSKAWANDLTANLRALWDEIAQRYKSPVDPASSGEQGSRVVIPQPKPVLSGYDAFIRANQRLILTGIRAIGNPVLTPSSVFPSPPTMLIRDESPAILRNFALDFDGINEDVFLGDVLDYEYNEPQSWEFWMNADTLVDWFYLIVKRVLPNDRGYQITWIGDNLSWAIIRDPAFQEISVQRAFTTTGVFKHVVVTYDGSVSANGMKIYVNSVVGQVISSDTIISSSILSDAPLTFASWQQQALSWFDGKLDCIRNYNRNLVQADVNILFNGGAGLYDADPLGDGNCKGAWMFCTGAESTLFDISGNNYHGTLRNMEPGGWVPGKVPCPAIPGTKQLEWSDPDDLPVGGKIRVWLLSYDANVHKQHVATIDRGVEAWIPDFVRIAQGASVPIASMPGHYLFQLDAISPNGNQSPPSNTIEAVCPLV